MTDNAFGSADITLKSVDNAFEMADKALEMADNALETADNALETADNALESAGDSLERGAGWLRRADKSSDLKYKVQEDADSALVRHERMQPIRIVYWSVRPAVFKRGGCFRILYAVQASPHRSFVS